MSDLWSYVKRNRFKIALLIVVLLIFIGFSFYLIPNIVIQDYERLLDKSDLSIEETWRYQGALQWWRSTSVTVFNPLAVFLVIINGSILFLISWKKIQSNKSVVKSLNSVSSRFSASSNKEVTVDQAELEELRRKVWTYRRLPTRLAGYAVTFVGSAVLIGSMVVSSTVWAIVGLPLVFWGILFFFLKPTSLVKADLLDVASYSLFENVRRLVSEFGLKGKGVYLPPSYLKDLRGGLVFISANEEMYVPTLDEVENTGDKVFLKNPKGVFLVPSGVALANLCEKELGTSFAKVDLEYLIRNLPKVFVEALEIAKDIEFSVESNRVHVRIEGSVYKDICDTRKDSGICGSFGCPLCSSIACILARATGRPVVMDGNEFQLDKKITDIHYSLLEK